MRFPKIMLHATGGQAINQVNGRNPCRDIQMSRKWPFSDPKCDDYGSHTCTYIGDRKGTRRNSQSVVWMFMNSLTPPQLEAIIGMGVVSQIPLSMRKGTRSLGIFTFCPYVQKSPLQTNATTHMGQRRRKAGCSTCFCLICRSIGSVYKWCSFPTIVFPNVPTFNLPEYWQYQERATRLVTGALLFSIHSKKCSIFSTLVFGNPASLRFRFDAAKFATKRSPEALSSCTADEPFPGVELLTSWNGKWNK